METKTVEIKWMGEAEKKDYAAAKAYLCLIYDESDAKRLVRKLKRAPLTQFDAKDIFRASGLSFLGVSNLHVEKDKRKVEAGLELAPVLLVRDQAHGKVVIADGYHRMCAVYSYDEDAVIPCKIV